MSRGAEKLVYHTSVVVMPPPEEAAPIVAIKKNHMNPRIKRPPFAHITLLAPFVDTRHFDVAEQLITKALANMDPFEVNINELKIYNNKGSCTLYLDPITPNNPNALFNLYDTVSGVYPESKAEGNAFDPHIGIGYFKGPNSLQEGAGYQAKYQKDWRPQKFTVKEVYFMSRVGQETPFEVRRVIPIGVNKVDKTAPNWPPKPL